jgi:hypothetical protein
MNDTEFTVEKQRPAHWFKPGQSGNAAGRPRGAKSKLSERFLEDLRSSWEKFGAQALERCALESPDQYCRIVAGLQPREIDIGVDVAVLTDVTTTVEAFRALSEMIGAKPNLMRLKRLAPGIVDGTE